jgi:DNA-binding transcriptional LysR family regulator
VICVEWLEALDHLIWLRTGQRAAEALDCTQPTVSRNSRKCLDTFELQLERCRGEWQLIGDTHLLNLERQVHQHRRWMRDLTLRLEAQHWSAPGLDQLALPQWRRGNLNQFDYEQPLALLEQGVIDAWICSAPDAPLRPGLSALQLTTMPMNLVVPIGHPLAERSGAIPWEDLLPYPVLPLPSGAFPVFERVLEHCGLVPSPEREQAMRQAPWWRKRPVEELVIGYASPLTLHSYGEGWVMLDQQLPVQVGDVLMVRQEFSTHPRTLELCGQLLEHLSTLAAGHPDVVLHRNVNQAAATSTSATQ